MYGASLIMAQAGTMFSLIYHVNDLKKHNINDLRAAYITALYTQNDRMKSLRVPYNTLEKRIKNKTFILNGGKKS